MITRRLFMNPLRLAPQTRLSPVQLPINVLPVVETPKPLDNLRHELSFSPIKPFLQVFLNGLLQREGLDYTLTDTIIEFVPLYKDTPIKNLMCYYIRL